MQKRMTENFGLKISSKFHWNEIKIYSQEILNTKLK